MYKLFRKKPSIRASEIYIPLYLVQQCNTFYFLAVAQETHPIIEALFLCISVRKTLNILNILKWLLYCILFSYVFGTSLDLQLKALGVFLSATSK